MGEKKQIAVYLEPSQHKELKRIAIENDTTVTAIIEKAVKDIIEQQKKK